MAVRKPKYNYGAYTRQYHYCDKHAPFNKGLDETLVKAFEIGLKHLSRMSFADFNKGAFYFSNKHYGFTCDLCQFYSTHVCTYDDYEFAPIIHFYLCDTHTRIAKAKGVRDQTLCWEIEEERNLPYQSTRQKYQKVMRITELAKKNQKFSLWQAQDWSYTLVPGDQPPVFGDNSPQDLTNKLVWTRWFPTWEAAKKDADRTMEETLGKEKGKICLTYPDHGVD